MASELVSKPNVYLNRNEFQPAYLKLFRSGKLRRRDDEAPQQFGIF